MAHFVVEAFFVGLATLVLGTLLSVGSMYLQPGFKISEIKFWPSLLAVNFLIGFILHIVFEIAGLNKWYCKNGYACKSTS